MHSTVLLKIALLVIARLCQILIGLPKNMLLRIFKMIATSGFLTALECTILYSLFLTKNVVFTPAMHFSAKRGIAIACRLSICPFVCPSVTLNGTAPRYLAADLRRLSDMPSRRRLRSSLTDQLDVRQSQCSTVGDRAFAMAGARLWNSLPHDIVASDTLSHFRRQSYPSILF